LEDALDLSSDRLLDKLTNSDNVLQPIWGPSPAIQKFGLNCLNWNTQRFFHHVPQHRSSHRMSRRMLALYAVTLPCSGKR